MINTLIPHHAFISYSHADEAFVKKMIIDLNYSNIVTWVDRTGLGSGTPNWNTAIRDAIHHSFALLFVASPHSGQSDVVLGEISLARSLGCPIYPLWIKGDEWTECAPIEMAHAQYIDCRGRRSTQGVTQIIKVLQEVIATKLPKHCLYTYQYLISIGKFTFPSDYLLVHIENEADQWKGGGWTQQYGSFWFHCPPEKLDDEEDGNMFIALRPNAYQSFQSLLDDLYMNYLRDRYDAFTYGSRWILCSTGISERLFVPWEWLTRPSEQPISSYYYSQENDSTGFYGLSDYSSLGLIDGPLESAIGIATNNDMIARLLSGKGDGKLREYFLDLLDHTTRPQYKVLLPRYETIELKPICIKPVVAEAVKKNIYKYLFIFSSHVTGKKAFIVE